MIECIIEGDNYVKTCQWCNKVKFYNNIGIFNVNGLEVCKDCYDYLMDRD
jgi:hypothetical protein